MTNLNAQIVTLEDGIPTLSFRENAHLSWFRGYRFQVSATTEGVGDYGSSSSSLQQDLGILSNYNVDENEDKVFRHYMTLSHVFQASAYFPELWELLYKDGSLLNKLIRSTTAEVDDNLSGEDFALHMLLHNVKVTNGVESVNPLECIM